MVSGEKYNMEDELEDKTTGYISLEEALDEILRQVAVEREEGKEE